MSHHPKADGIAAAAQRRMRCPLKVLLRERRIADEMAVSETHGAAGDGLKLRDDP